MRRDIGYLAAAALAQAALSRPLDEVVRATGAPTPGGRPTTMPRWDGPHMGGARLNPARQAKKKAAAAFLAEHGRPMNPKDWRRLRTRVGDQVPALLDVGQMVTK